MPAIKPPAGARRPYRYAARLYALPAAGPRCARKKVRRVRGRAIWLLLFSRPRRSLARPGAVDGGPPRSYAPALMRVGDRGPRLGRG